MSQSKEKTFFQKPARRTLEVGAAILCLGVMGFASYAAIVPGSPEDKIAESFPKTEFDRIYKHKETGLWVGEAGDTVLYFTASGRFALVGNVLDLEKKVDITDARKKELQAANVLEAKAFGKPLADQPIARPEAQGQRPPTRPDVPANMDVELPIENMVVHNPGASKVMYVVSDYNCSFCKRLHSELKFMDVEVREIPVGFLGQESALKGAAALCSDDPSQTAITFYEGTASTQITTCTEGEEKVRANTEWAQSKGITGTPFLVRENGLTNSGYLPAARLTAFLDIAS